MRQPAHAATRREVCREFVPGALVVGAGVLGAFVSIAVAVIVGGRLAASRRR